MATSRVQTLRSSVKGTRPTAGSRQPGELFVNFPDLALGVVDPGQNPVDLVAVRYFSGAADYLIGDYVVRAGVLYRAKANMASGAFNPVNWDAVVTFSQLLSADGAGSGLDADLLDGQQGVFYLDLGNATGVLPSDATHGARGGGGLHSVATSASAGFLSGADKTKLDNVEAGATGDMTAAEILTSVKTVDGVGSGLDADLLDGQSSAFFQDASNMSAGTLPAGRINDTSHGNLGGGTLHALATSAARGFFVDAASDSKQYVRKNAAWQEVVVPPNTFVGDAPPPTPADGQLWWESDSGRLFIYFNDLNSTQWVQINVAGSPGPIAVDAPVDGLPYIRQNGVWALAPGTAQARSRVVNGAMQISQENGDTGTATTGAYPVDQWVLGFSGLTGVAGLRLTPGGTNQRGLAIQFTVAKPSLAASDLGMLTQPIEGNKLADFYWGSASARQVVLRFDIFSQIAGTFPVSIRNGAANRSWLGSYTIAAGEVSKYVTKTIVIPGDVTGTWPVDNTAGMLVAFGFVVGSTYVGIPGWQAGNMLAPPSMTNGAAVTGSFFIANVGLYLDPQATGVAPAWTMPDEAQELFACQRYYYRLLFNHIFTASAAGQFLGMTAVFPAQMRTAPTLALLGSGTAANCTAFIDQANVLGCRTYITATAAGAASLNQYVASASARM